MNAGTHGSGEVEISRTWPAAESGDRGAHWSANPLDCGHPRLRRAHWSGLRRLLPRNSDRPTVKTTTRSTTRVA